MATAWRLAKPRHATPVEAAFTGEGARLYGGRWNSPGLPMVYTAGSLALAALELLVHVEAHAVLERFVAIPVAIPDGIIVDLAAPLPEGWREDQARTRRLGDEWLRAGAGPVLRVPSAIVPQESNLILNPRHSGFARIVPGEPALFAFDPRLARS